MSSLEQLNWKKALTIGLGATAAVGLGLYLLYQLSEKDQQDQTQPQMRSGAGFAGSRRLNPSQSTDQVQPALSKQKVGSVLRTQIEETRKVCRLLSEKLRIELATQGINPDDVSPQSQEFKDAFDNALRNPEVAQLMIDLKNAKVIAFNKESVSEPDFNASVKPYLNDREIVTLVLNLRDLVTLTFAGRQLPKLPEEVKLPDASPDLIANMAIEESRMLLEFAFRTFRKYCERGEKVSMKNISFFEEFKKTTPATMRKTLMDKFEFSGVEDSVQAYGILFGQYLVSHPQKFQLIQDYKKIQGNYFKELLGGLIDAKKFNEYLDNYKLLDELAVAQMKETGPKGLNGGNVELVLFNFEKIEDKEQLELEKKAVEKIEQEMLIVNKKKDEEQVVEEGEILEKDEVEKNAVEKIEEGFLKMKEQDAEPNLIEAGEGDVEGQDFESKVVTEEIKPENGNEDING